MKFIFILIKIFCFDMCKLMFALFFIFATPLHIIVPFLAIYYDEYNIILYIIWSIHTLLLYNLKMDPVISQIIFFHTFYNKLFLSLLFILSIKPTIILCLYYIAIEVVILWIIYIIDILGRTNKEIMINNKYIL